MTAKLFFIFIFLSNINFAYSTSLISSDSLNAADTTKLHKISITSNLENARIYFDTVFTGISPLLNLSVAEGQYKIKIYNPKSLKDWESENRIIDIYIDRDTAIDVSFRYFYYFNTSPFNAAVFSNDSLLGNTPLRFFKDHELTGNLIFKKKNYKDYMYDLKSYDFETGASITLQPKGLETVNDLVYKDRVTQFKTRRSLITIAGLAAASIVGGYFAITYKNKANDAYDNYLNTGSHLELDKSKSNDTYFVISLVLMQAAVGGLIYFLFFDK